MDRDIKLLMLAYSKEDLARKYDSAQKEVLRLEAENKKLNEEILQWRKALPIGCPECNRGCFANDKYCGHCGTKLK